MTGIPESVGATYTIAVPLELVPRRDGLFVPVPNGSASVAVKLPGGPGEVMTVAARFADLCFQIGGPTVQATRASHLVFAGNQPTFAIPATARECTHISFFGLGPSGEAIVNLYRRGS